MFLYARIAAVALLAGGAFTQVALPVQNLEHPWEPSFSYPGRSSLTWEHAGSAVQIGDLHVDLIGDLHDDLDIDFYGFNWSALAPPSVTEAERPHIGGPVVSSYLATGEFVHDEVDLRIAGRGLDVVIARRNRSRISRSSLIGVGWYFSYDIAVSADQGGLVLRDGHGRRDLFSLQGGVYTAAGVPMTGVMNGDQTYTFTFPDGGKWDLRALDGTAARGKIASIVDRNGNVISFAYDAAGRMTTITDTLSRNVTLGYDTAGHIATISDFAGRQVVYSYYGPGDPNGNAGDLKSVRTPVVTGTPNANDFPAGKTTTYTYFVPSGGTHPSLRHNLLTITDAAGKQLLHNTYGTSGDTLDFLVKQELGSSGESLNLSITWLKTTSANGFANHVVIVNDRAGNVSEHYFDGMNRLVVMREFTGRATAGVATTLTTNRPTNKLRPSDPAFFETRWEYNLNSLVTRRVEPELNETLRAYQTTGSALARFNVVTRTKLAGPRGGDQVSQVWSRTYDSAHNLPLSETDPRNNVTTHVRDANGNCTKTTHALTSIVEDFEYNAFGQVTAHVLPADASAIRRRDEYHYYTGGPLKGYLQERVVDAGAGPPFLRLTTTYEYDALGRVVRTIDPRGNDALFDVNALGQVVRERSRQVAIGGGVRYEKLFFFDASNNLQYFDVQNIDENGLVGANAYFRTVYEYDALNRLTRKRLEIASGQEELTEYTYDANGNRAIERFNAAATGASPNNFNLKLWDERDLLFQDKRAPNATGHSTTQFDYDRNGGLVSTRKGLESNPRGTTLVRDGFDRVAQRTDAMGNVETLHYDANGNQVSRRLDGELADVAGSSSNLRLEDSTAVFDAMNRATSRTRSFFDPLTQTNYGTGSSTVSFVWDGLAGLVTRTDTTGGVATQQFDRAHRVSLGTDAKGNSLAYQYDANGNVTQLTERHKADSGAPDVLIITTRTFDAVDRMTSSQSPAGTREYQFTSRGALVVAKDELGNSTICNYDGLLRRTSAKRELRAGGTGQGALVSEQLTTYSWKQVGLMSSITNDNGHTTQFVYDDLNRLVQTIHADGTQESCSFDVHDDPVLTIDGNQTQVSSTFDALGRPISRSVTIVQPYVEADVTAEIFVYDGRSGLVSAADDDSLVQREYDSLGALRREIATIGIGWPNTTIDTTEITTDAAGAWTQLIYPGGRIVNATRDALHRATQIVDSFGVGTGPLEYLGPSHLERITLTNNTQSTFSYDTSLRPTQAQTKFDPNATNITRVLRTVSWTANHRLASRANGLSQAGSTNFAYTVDSLGRLSQSLETPQVGPPATLTYSLDDIGNRTQVQGGPDQGAYSMNCATPMPADCQMSQYTQTPFDDRVYDENGNARRLYGVGAAADVASYDYANRLCRYVDTSTGQTHRYKYDALGRRIAKIVDSTGAPTETRFFHFGDQVIEEQNHLGTTLATFLRLPSTNVVSMRRAGVHYFFHPDAVGNVAAVTNNSGAVVERYEYSDFGTPRIRDGSGLVIAQSAIGNPHLLRDAWLDAETALYALSPQVTARSVIGNPTLLHDAGATPYSSMPGNSADTNTFDARSARTLQRGISYVSTNKRPQTRTAISNNSKLRPWLAFGKQSGNEAIAGARSLQSRPWLGLKGMSGNDVIGSAQSLQSRPWLGIKGMKGNCLASRSPYLQPNLSLGIGSSGLDGIAGTNSLASRPWLGIKGMKGNCLASRSTSSELRSWVGIAPMQARH